MSLILDALKRAQENRQPNDQVSGSTPILLPAAANTRQPSHKLLWLIILLLVAILILLWFLLKKTSDPVSVSVPVPTQQAVEPQTVEQPVVQVEETQHSVASSSSVQPAVASSLISDLYQQARSSLPSIKDVQIAQLYVETTDITTAAIAEQKVSVSVTDPFPDPNSRLPKTLQVSADIRRLEDVREAIRFEDLSLTQRQQFPSINYSQHNYLGNSASSVVINGQLMRAGSNIGEDVKIMEIVEDGIVLDFNGRRVSFRALSSWINM